MAFLGELTRKLVSELILSGLISNPAYHTVPAIVLQSTQDNYASLFSSRVCTLLLLTVRDFKKTCISTFNTHRVPYHIVRAIVLLSR